MSEGDVAVTAPCSNLPAILCRAGVHPIHPAVLVFPPPSVYLLLPFDLPTSMHPPQDPSRLPLFDSFVRDSATGAHQKAGAIFVLPVVGIIITASALHVL